MISVVLVFPTKIMLQSHVQPEPSTAQHNQSRWNMSSYAVADGETHSYIHVGSLTNVAFYDIRTIFVWKAHVDDWISRRF